MKLKSFCTAKETIQDGKTNPRMGENIYKQCVQQMINLQNLQTSHAVQYQKKNNNQKTTQSKNGQKT